MTRHFVVALIFAVLLLPLVLADSPTWRNQYRLSGELDEIHAASLLGDGDFAVIAGSNPSFIGLVDAATGVILWKVRSHAFSRPQSVAASDDARVIAAPYESGNNQVRVFLDRSPVPAWSHPTPGNGELIAVDVSSSGNHVLVVTQHGPGGTTLVEVLDRAGALKWEARLDPVGWPTTAAGKLDHVKVSADGALALVVLSDITYVMAETLGAVALVPHLECCGDQTVDMSEDGRFLALGDSYGVGNVLLYERAPIAGVFLPKWNAESGRNAVLEVALSDDGSTLVVGANRRWGGPAVNFDNGLVSVFDTGSTLPTPLWQYANYADSGKIDALSLAADGSRFAVGAYSSLDDDTRDVFTVFDRASPTPLFRMDRSDRLGSVVDAGISDDGHHAFAHGSTGHPYTGVADRVLVGVRGIP